MTNQELSLPELRTRFLGRPTFHYREVESTQDILRQLAAEGALHGTTVLADHQTQGRGRQGRIWFSLPPPQLYASVLLVPPLPDLKVGVLSIAAGLALAQAMEEHGIADTRVKWPNDVTVNRKKASGILAERVILRGAAPAVLLGFGINITASLDHFPAGLRDRATALSLHARDRIGPDRFRLLGTILADLERFYDEIVRGDPSAVQLGFRKRWLYRDRQIQIRIGNRLFTGVADEIDPDGALLLQCGSGEALRVVSGEILPF
ncbi:MAG: biotin--[acetyl-CoA-carboxylase] ligase [Pseudomonadota bacterium]